MATKRFASEDPDVDLLYKQLAEHDLQPLWELHGLLTPQPRTRAVPFAWKSDVLLQLAGRAGELIPVDRGGDRRVLSCANPGLDGQPYAVGTLWAAVQYLGAGEQAPAHRHTPAALRFVLAGRGVWTVVDGDPIPMEAGDLVLTPSWTFHEHHNSGDAPMMWLDVLDLPMVAALDAVFFEEGESETVTVSTPDSSRSERLHGGGPGLVPVGVEPPAGRSPLLAYRWADTERALVRRLDAGARYAHVRFSDPASGRDVMPTMRCEMLRVPAGVAVPEHRQTGARVGCVLHGTARAEIGGRSFALSEGDIVAIPSWAPLRLTAEADLDLFVTSDAPVLAALGLYREQQS
ncbi:cupin domain-containing protein [Dactylosporangium sp. CA-092794]|uniref:cupin domain-containing protein n=1 Tax=Dactylosporangium sp. CA-092794 TaxID=3239929 RepID=UPI003D8A1E35